MRQLVQYQGGGYDGCIVGSVEPRILRGGYDGCFWEWNFFYLGGEGKFHDIFSSGRHGITTKEKALELLESDDTFYAYNLDDPDALKEIATESNAIHLKGLVKWFDENTEIRLFAVCSKCKDKITDADEIILVDWHGCGGIASTADTIICNECYTDKVCEECGDYEDTTVYDEKTERALCDCCREEAAK